MLAHLVAPRNGGAGRAQHYPGHRRGWDPFVTGRLPPEGVQRMHRTARHDTARCINAETTQTCACVALGHYLFRPRPPSPHLPPSPAPAPARLLSMLFDPPIAAPSTPRGEPQHRRATCQCQGNENLREIGSAIRWLPAANPSKRSGGGREDDSQGWQQTGAAGSGIP